MDIPTHQFYKEEERSADAPSHQDLMPIVRDVASGVVNALVLKPDSPYRSVMVISDDRNNNADYKEANVVRLDIVFTPKVATSERGRIFTSEYPPAYRVEVFNKISADLVRRRLQADIRQLLDYDKRMAE